MLLVNSQRRFASRLTTKRVTAATRAYDQHIQWIRSTNKEEQASREISRIDPIVRPKELKIRSSMEFETTNRANSMKSSPDANKSNTDSVAMLKDIISPSFHGELSCIDFGAFGKISAAHGDILSYVGENAHIVVPLPPNLTPYRGLALEVLERGGDDLVRKMFTTARHMYAEHVMPEASMADEDRAMVSDQKSRSPEPCRGIPIGSVIPADKYLFVVVPHFWQGTNSDANQRLRLAVKSVVKYAHSSGGSIRHLVIPHIGRGQFGYDADWSFEALAEEAIDELLQLDARETVSSSPIDLTFIDNDMSVAEQFKDTLSVLGDRWLPDRRSITAPQYWSKQSRRLIVMDETSELQTMRRRDKFKFKQYHGKLRNLGGKYFRDTLQPWIWRTQKVLEPPPLMVKEKSGEIADKQLAARPYFFRGLSHTLYDTSNMRTGFPSMRRSKSGQLVGVNRQPDTQKIAKPRS